MTDALQIVAGSRPDAIRACTPLAPFSEQATGFLLALSGELLGNPVYRAHPGLVALGFWLRDGSIRKMADTFGSAPSGYLLRPAGLAFHLTPSNVDNLFIYSWAISLLCGNNNIIRLSSKESAERDVLLALIGKLLEMPEHQDICDRTAILSYGHDDQTTISLSALADRRIIWGGDNTVAHLRALPVPPLCQDIVFPDRHSCALLSAAAVLQADDLDALLEDFYRDTYGFNQMACSSPRLLIWLHDGDLAAARSRFWPALALYVDRQCPPLSPAELMDKQVAMQSIAMQTDLKIRTMPDQLLQVIELERPDAGIEAEHCGGGLFLEGVADELPDVAAWLQRKHQTLTHWGITLEAVDSLTGGILPTLPDRIVPVGQALNFDPVWDGMNLFERLSRLVQVG